MKMIEVDSSNLASVGYEAGTLVVEFKRGQRYHYNGVPESEYQALLQAESKGKFFNQNIKDSYPYTKEE